MSRKKSLKMQPQLIQMTTKKSISQKKTVRKCKTKWNSYNTKEVYYDSLQKSSIKWHENANDYEPFVKYMLGVIVAAYRDFSSRVKWLTTENLSKPERLREIIRTTMGTITKSELLKRCPDISQVTVQRTLAELMETDEITKIGGGRYTKYTWNNK